MKTEKAEIKVLPTEGWISIPELANFLGRKRYGRLEYNLKRQGIIIRRLSDQTEGHLVNLADLLTLPQGERDMKKE